MISVSISSVHKITPYYHKDICSQQAECSAHRLKNDNAFFRYLSYISDTFAAASGSGVSCQSKAEQQPSTAYKSPIAFAISSSVSSGLRRCVKISCKLPLGCFIRHASSEKIRKIFFLEFCPQLKKACQALK